MDVTAAASTQSAIDRTMGAVNVAMLKKTQDFAATQAMDLINSIPQSPSIGAVGGNIDVNA